MATPKPRRSGKTSGCLTSRSGNESYLGGSLCSSGPRTSQARHRLWCGESDALRWRLPPASISLQDRFQASGLEGAPTASTEQPLQRRRDVARDDLSDDSRARATRDHPVAQAERGLPVSDRIADL